MPKYKLTIHHEVEFKAKDMETAKEKVAEAMGDTDSWKNHINTTVEEIK